MDDDTAPFLGLGDDLASRVDDRRDHPVHLRIGEGAADHVDAILAGARPGEQRIAAPHWPGDDFGAVGGQRAGDLGIESVVADHQADLAEFRLEDRIISAGCDALFDFTMREADLAVFAEQLACGAEQHRGVIDKMAVAFIKAHGDVEGVLLGEAGEILRRRAGDRLGVFRRRLPDVHVGYGLAEDDEVGLLLGGFGDQRGVFLAVPARGLAAGYVLDGREADFARDGRGSLLEDDVAPLDATLGCVLKVELDGGKGGLGRDLVDARQDGPSLRVGRSVLRVFGLGGRACDRGGDDLALGVGPDDARESAVARVRDAGRLARGAERYGKITVKSE